MSHVRRSVDLSGYPDLVVIYLGYRATGPRGVRTLLRVGRGLRAIKADPPEGLLSHEDLWFGLMHPGFRQYWRDFARDPRGGGIWHETYRIGGGMEAIYAGVPPIGLASFAPQRDPVGPFMSARQRVTAGA